MEATRNPNLEVRPPRLPPPQDELVGPRPDWYWTGPPPVPGRCAGVDANGTIRALPTPDLRRVSRQVLLDYFDNGWAITEVLFSALQGARAFYQPPYHRLRHPLIFYYAHPAALYVNKLRLAGLLDQPLRPEFETLFETGVDEMSWDDLSRGELDWPALREVTEYRRSVYHTVRELVVGHPELDGQPIAQRSPWWSLVMGMEHERIHVELSSVLVRELPVELVRRPAEWPADAPARRPRTPSPTGDTHPDNPLLPVEEGDVVLGKPEAWPSYGWDNEYGERHELVPPFRAARMMVTNGELHEFVRGGGYTEPRYWTRDGWQWRTYRNAKWPTFWVSDGPAGLHRYKLRALFDVIDMPWDWPVEVNAHEARAYCAFRAEADGRPYRLLTEREHHRLRPPRCPTTNGHGPDEDAYALALRTGSPRAVDAGPPSPSGHHDAFGNVWCWLEDHFNPLPGFRVHQLYDDFSTPCFDGKHQMIAGGSFISMGEEAGWFARFHFRPHFLQHCGFRLVAPDDASLPDGAVRLAPNKRGAFSYESEEFLAQYLLLHYGGYAMPVAADALGFPQRCAELLLRACDEMGVSTHRAIDVGCAVGGACFGLARAFEEVIGLDLSAQFIRTAETLRREGAVDSHVVVEGDLREPFVARVDEGIDRDRVSFRQADACAMPAELVGFDAVLIANLICRVPSPRAVLGRMGGARGLVRPGGLLLITSPFTWREEFTPRDVWLGGFERDGSPVRSVDGLRALLEPEFELVDVRDMPLLLREHARKYEHIVSCATLWRRR